MEFKEYLAIIRRRWLLFFPIFVLIVGAHLVWVSYSQRNHFSATSKVILGSGEGQNQPPIGINVLDGLSLSTKESTLTHRPVLEVAAALVTGESNFESAEFNEGEFQQTIEQGRRAIKTKYPDPQTAHSRVIESLTNVVSVSTSRDREIADITAEGESEAVALLLSWAMAEGAYQFHNEKARETVTSYIDNLQAKIAQAERLVERAAREVTPQDLSSQEKLIREAILEYKDRDAELDAMVRKQDKVIQERISKNSWDRRDDAHEALLVTNKRMELLREELFKVKLTYETKIPTLAPEHPDMKQIRAKMIGLENAIAEEQGNLIQERFQRFSAKTRELISERGSMQLSREVYREQVERLQGELREVQDLRRQYAPKEAALADARERLANLREVEKEVRWYADSRLGSVIVYDPAIKATPVVLRGGGFGPLTLTMLMAFIFALGIVYIVEYVDTRMKNEHDIRRHLNLPLLGIIPKEPENDRLLVDAPLQSEISEKFNTAATLLQSVSSDLGIRALMVCSAIAREGKTTVSINLAVALARKGARVVLIDGDLRISQVHNLLRVPNHAGLSTVLDSRVNASQLLEGVMTDEELEGRQLGALNLVQSSGVENLDILPAGPQVADPVVLLDPTRLQRLVAELKQSYDFVIFDTPPINKVGDALTISSAVDGSVFVVGAGQAEQQEVTWAKHLLTNVQSNILGVFLNKFTKQRGGGEYYYYYYYNDKKRKRVKSRA